MTVSLGNPAQEVDLYPAGQYGSFYLTGNNCWNETLNVGLDHCAAEIAGVWNWIDSSTAIGGLVSYQPPVAFSSPLPLRASQTWMILDDVFMQYDGPAKPVHNASLNSVAWAYNEYPGGQKIPVSVGTLCLGAASVNWTFNIYSQPGSGSDATSGSVNASVLQSSLMVQDIIPSASFGMHIGSVRAGIEPSLWQGGYDKSRALSPVVSQTVPEIGGFEINLVDITIGTAAGASVFPFNNATGLLGQGNSSIQESGITVTIEPGTPYLFLPRSTCDAIVHKASLPVTFSQSLGLYLWDTSNDNYHTIITSTTYLGFEFRAPDGSTMMIKAPWKLMNLTLTSPLVDVAKPYFPCYPHAGEDYTLGRAFLQAAFIGANWKPTAPPAYWFLAQAPGPNTATTALVASIDDSDKGIRGLDTDWADTWDGFWTVEPKSHTMTADPAGPETQQPMSDSRKSSHESGTSTGVKIGIAVAVSVALLSATVLGIILYQKAQRRRRRNGQQLEGFTRTISHSQRRHMPTEKDSSVLCEADPHSQPLGKPENPVETDGQVWVQELPHRTSRFAPSVKELPARTSRSSSSYGHMKTLPPRPPIPTELKEYHRLYKSTGQTPRCQLE